MTVAPLPLGAMADTSLMGAEHVRRYQETDGAVGYLWNGAPILLLTTTGHKSGEQRTTPLIFTQVGDELVIIASQGGAPKHPAWYLNLKSEPHAAVQIKADRFAVTARTAQPPEREALWREATKLWPRYDSYAERTSRIIPVVVLKRS